MQKTIVIAGIVAILSGCVTAQQSAQRSADMQRDMRIASEMISSKDHEACIAEYKTNMHDPSSFELAGNFYLNDIATRVTYGQTWDYGPGRRVVYSTRVRGRNSYGGLVLGSMDCIYEVYDHGIEFWTAKSGAK